MNEIKVKFDRATFSCNIDISEIEPSRSSEIRFQVMNRWESIDFHLNSIQLQYYQLKRTLPVIANWCKINSIALSLDSDLQGLIKEFARDKRGFRGEKLSLPTSFKGIQNTLDDIGFQRTLTKKQVQDVVKLIGLYQGANFSVPGAGKTTTLLALHSILRALGIVNKMLVVCPINAFISWETEVDDIYKGNIIIQRLNKDLIQEFSASSFPDGKNLERVTHGKTFDAFPVFSNNGKFLAFSSNRNNGGTRDTNLFIAEWQD